MAKCAACGKFISPRGGAGCTTCNNKYHPQCLSMPESGKLKSDWQCKECRLQRPKDLQDKHTLLQGNIVGNETTPTSSYDSSQSTTTSPTEGAAPPTKEQHNQTLHCGTSPRIDIGRELQDLRVELRAMRDDIKTELREFRLEMADLRRTVATCKAKVESFEERLGMLESRHESPTSPENLEVAMSRMRAELNEREQELLLSDLEISNMPECPGENVQHTVELVAKKLGVDIESRDIVYAERVGPRIDQTADKGAGRKKHRCIVVRMARRGLRDDLLRSARVRRGATSSDLGLNAPPQRFYINERLTKTNKQLFYKTRQLAATHGWKYSWTRRGKIFSREKDGSRTEIIRTETDLVRVFGSDIDTAVKD